MNANRQHSEKPDYLMVLVPAVTIWRFKDRLILDRKYYDGLAAYRAQWPGKIKLVISWEEILSEPPFGGVDYNEQDIGVDVLILNEGEKLQGHDLEGASVVLASADSHYNLYLPDLCNTLSIPCVMDIEYTLKTRLQMARQEQPGLLKFAKTAVWLLLTEIKRRSAIKASAGIQANGLPAFKAYANHHENSMYYFDNRMDTDMIIEDSLLRSRLASLKERATLRLAFSGRLIKSKGADALVDLAIELVSLKIPFVLNIFGKGDQEGFIRERIARENLYQFVKFHGAVDFKTVLIPFLQNEVDLFVCCHRQGDPSCTYLETYGCGLPIAGYDNEAHQSMVDAFDTGWYVPMDAVSELANLIKTLEANRQEIIVKSEKAVEFAREYRFIKIFNNRISHCMSVANAE